MRIRRFLALLCLMSLMAPMSAASAQTRGETGLPIPRFVSTKGAPVNVRTGPGQRYPIQYVYIRAAIPLEITAEFEQWRRVRDIEGDEGWVHRGLLSGRRMAIIQNGTQTLYARPSTENARAVLWAEAGVFARIDHCEGRWCRVDIKNIKGWIPRRHLWGVYPDEDVD